VVRILVSEWLPTSNSQEVKMKTGFHWFVALAMALVATIASAEYHTYVIEQLFSNASGTVQFIVMHESQGMSIEYFWAGNPLILSHLGQSQRFTFPNNLPIGMACDPYYGCGMAAPISTANTRVLIATQGFADLHIVTPDYVIPNGFIDTTGGTLNYAGVDFYTYASLPTDGTTAINRSGARIPNVATNFSGASASVAAAATVINYQGLWYKAPAESESGWGINFAHQGDIIFATWFTYDVNGKAWWLTMQANKTAEGVYSGQLKRTNGAPFSAFVPPATGTTVGTGTLTFTGATTGTFSYTVNDGANVATQTKAIVLQAFGPVPTCVFGAQPDLTKATNYQDLWYAAPAESEAGWGVNLTQQGTIIFATWFTYDANHNPLWLYAIAPQTGPNTFAGALTLTVGPAFNAVPFDPAKVTRIPVGTATFTFTNGNAGTFSYNVDLGDGVNKATQTKAITRQVFSAPGTVCFAAIPG
jgi:hypothetical protein